jgi:hypothetical protein
VEELTELRMDRPHDIALITLGLKHRALRREASVSGEATADL